MPRKQVSRRRRGRKSVQYDFADSPEGEVSPEEGSQDDAEAEEDFEDEGAPGAEYVRSGASEIRVRHVNRDYTHVRSEVVRIAILGSVLISGIVIAGFFR